MKRFMFVLLAAAVVLASAGALWAADMEADRGAVEMYLVSNELYTPAMLNELSFNEVFDRVYNSRNGITVDELIRDNQAAYNYHQAYLAFEILLALDFNRRVEAQEIDNPAIRKPKRPSPNLPCGCPR